MAVTDEQVAALRAYLTGDLGQYERLVDQLDPEAARTGYSALLAAAFFEAVDRRFVNSGTTADVAKFVGDVRAKSERLSKIDPLTAERLIRHSLGEGSIADLDNETVISNQFLLLGALIVDEQLNEAGLDQFLAEARTVADEWTS